MSEIETIFTIVIAIAGGSAGAAIITAITERWKFKASRQATKEDKLEEKADRTKEIEKSLSGVETDTKELEDKITAQAEAVKLILLDRILCLGESYIKRGEITMDERRRINEMYRCYHYGLGGNGDADFIINSVDELELKREDR